MAIQVPIYVQRLYHCTNSVSNGITNYLTTDRAANYITSELTSNNLPHNFDPDARSNGLARGHAYNVCPYIVSHRIAIIIGTDHIADHIADWVPVCRADRLCRL